MEIDDNTAKWLVEMLWNEDDPGFTYPRPPNKGFMVAGGGYSEKLDWTDFCAKAGNDLAVVKLRISVLVQSFARFKVHDGRYIGGWYSSDDNTVWIEESQHFYTRDLAYRRAKEWKQKEIYDLKNKCSVKVEDMYNAGT